MSENAVEKVADTVEDAAKEADKRGILKPVVIASLLAGGVAMATQWNDLIATLAKPQIDAAVSANSAALTKAFADAMMVEQKDKARMHAAHQSLIASVRTLPQASRRQIPADILEWKP